MEDDVYEYRGLMAESWDLFRGDTSRWADRFLYLDLIAEYGEPALDVGCGTGRLLLDYLQQGIDIDGVDNSPEMLALCRQKAATLALTPTLFQQRMDQLALPRRYRIILVPSSSFQLLLTPEEARAAMVRFVAHLEPGGLLVMPFHLPWQEGEPIEQAWTPNGEAARPDGSVVRRWARAWYDVEAQLEHTEDRYEIWQGEVQLASEQHRQSPATRWYSQVQARALYEEAGLTSIRLWEGFTHQIAAADSRLFTLLGTKPQPHG